MRPEPQAPANNRLESVDGLRGIAIILVVFFHAFVRWTEHVPYGDQYASPFLFAQGWVGVELFFIISGFVIFMTLEKCKGTLDFLVRRWIRLFPAMFIGSVIIFTTAPLFTDRPMGMPQLQDMLPGLTFIEPAWWSAILGVEQKMLEGVFWSLFVEMKFYFIAGFSFFLIGKQRLILLLLALFLAARGVEILNRNLDWLNLDLIDGVLFHMSARYFGWFAAGALFYEYWKSKDMRTLLAAMVVCALSVILIHKGGMAPRIAAAMVVGLFAAVMVSPLARRIVSWQPFLFIGYISYPLYLIHENMMMSMIVQLHNVAPQIPALLLPVLPVAVVMAIAFVIAHYLEPASRDWMKNACQKVRLLPAKAAR